MRQADGYLAFGLPPEPLVDTAGDDEIVPNRHVLVLGPVGQKAAPLFRLLLAPASVAFCAEPLISKRPVVATPAALRARTSRCEAQRSSHCETLSCERSLPARRAAEGAERTRARATVTLPTGTGAAAERCFVALLTLFSFRMGVFVEPLPECVIVSQAQLVL